MEKWQFYTICFFLFFFNLQTPCPLRRGADSTVNNGTDIQMKNVDI